MGYIQEIRALVGSRPLILAGAIVMIFDAEGRILLQHRTDDNTWDFPGGFSEIGETLEETARREVWEEMGLQLDDLSFFQMFSGSRYAYQCPNGDQVFPVGAVYVSHQTTGRLNPDGEESSDAHFFPLDSLPEPMFPQVREIITAYRERYAV